MRDLRALSASLDEDEMFQQTLMRGSQIPNVALPSHRDIDALMQSMTVDPQPAQTMTNWSMQAQKPVARGPWNISTTSTAQTLIAHGTPAAAGRIEAKGKGRAQYW
jgi:hypothetical protein